MKSKTIIIWILRLTAAIILLQTLFFKFSAAPVSVFIFSELNMEPWGRIGTGIAELVAAILILYPKTTVYGSALGIALMAGAIFFHITKLGIEVENDSGKLFALAIVVFLSCFILFLVNYKGLVSKLSNQAS
ncbi:MAG: DoxX family protein [Flavobacterium sp.]|nr:MAG: DoxX family protein [Flavobacterium sp.]